MAFMQMVPDGRLILLIVALITGWIGNARLTFNFLMKIKI